MNWLFGYYVICLIYCFYQLNVKYKTRGIEYASPEMDAMMVLIMAWLLAPVDVSITWIRMVKKAEEARIRQSKFELDTSDFRNEETHIYQYMLKPQMAKDWQNEIDLFSLENEKIELNELNLSVGCYEIKVTTDKIIQHSKLIITD